MSAATAPPSTGRWHRYRRAITGSETRFVLLHLLLSRFIFLAGGLLTAGLMEAGGYAQLLPLFQSDAVIDRVALLLDQGDSNWYQLIVANGYEAIPFSAEVQHNWAFFPGFPVLVLMLGGSFAAGILVANVAAFLAARILFHEVRIVSSAAGARWTVLFLLYWPASGMLSAYRPESVLLLAAVMAWAAARRGHWWLAWLAVALATVTRPQGILVALLFIEPIWAQRHELRRSPWPFVIGALFPLIGIGIFSLHLWDITGDALAWIHIQDSWGRSGLAPLRLIESYWPPLFVGSEGWDFAFLNVLTVAVVVVATMLLVAARRYGFALFSFAWVAVPALLGPTLISMSRYVTGAFPVFMALATAPRLRRYRLAILLPMAAGLFGVGAWLSLGIRALKP